MLQTDLHHAPNKSRACSIPADRKRGLLNVRIDRRKREKGEEKEKKRKRIAAENGKSKAISRQEQKKSRGCQCSLFIALK